MEKQKTYTKVHTSDKAKDEHLRKIASRGGKAKVEKSGKGWKLTYHF